MSDDRFEVLLAAYLDGDLTTEASEELHQIVATSPKRRRELVAHVRLHQGLIADRASPFTTLAAVRERLHAGRSRVTGRRWLVGLLLAAAVLLAVGVGWLLRPTDAGTASIERGSLLAVEDGRRWSSTELPAGQRFRVLEPVDLRLRDGSRLQLAADSELRSPSEDGIWTLLQGGCSVGAEPRPPERPLRLATPEATVTVVGTAFDLQHREGMTALRVTEGEVQLQPRIGERQSVGAGQAAVVVDGRLAGLPAPEPEELLRYGPYDPGSSRLTDLVGGNDLLVDDPTAVVPLPGGGIHLRRPAMLVAAGDSVDLVERLQAAGGLTVEAWVLPDDLEQTGPARLFAISESQWSANLVVGMGGDHPNDTFCWSWRLRCDDTPGWGRPTRWSKRGLMREGWTHLVLTVTEGGDEILYRNGEELLRKPVGGVFHLWDPTHRIRIGNEADADRPWLGKLAFLSLRAGALDAATVVERHRRARPAIEMSDVP